MCIVVVKQSVVSMRNAIIVAVLQMAMLFCICSCAVGILGSLTLAPLNRDCKLRF